MIKFVVLFVLSLQAIIIAVSPRYLYHIRNITSAFMLGSLVAIGLYGIKDKSYPAAQLALLLYTVLGVYLALVCFYTCLAMLSERLGVRLKWLEGLQSSVEGRSSMVWVKNGPSLKARDVSRTVTAKSRPSAFSLLEGELFLIDICGTIDGELADRVRRDCLDAIASPHDKVRIEIRSGGGDYDAMHLIRRAIQDVDACKLVEVIAVGECYSAAVPLLTCVPLEQRASLKSARFMVHTGSSCHNHAGLKLANELLVETLVSETNIEQKSLERLFDSGRDYFFPVEEALHLGVVGMIY